MRHLVVIWDTNAEWPWDSRGRILTLAFVAGAGSRSGIPSGHTGSSSCIIAGAALFGLGFAVDLAGAGCQLGVEGGELTHHDLVFGVLV